MLAVILGSWARLTGELRVINPATLYSKWLHLFEPEFQSKMIYVAGEDYAPNKRLIYRKWLFSVLITILFFLEAACLALWVAGAGAGQANA